MAEKKYVIDNAELMAEWNWEKNNELGFDPKTLTLGSGQKVWWKCQKGHEWMAIISNRNRKSGCPYCSGRKAIIGENSLLIVNPDLAKEWNYEKNGGLTPATVMPHSGKKVWWKCNKGHEWQATVNTRNRGVGCPICNSERQTSFPEYALVYYLKKNGLEVAHSYREKGYELDIYIPSKKIGIEYDGYLWHRNKTKQDLIKNRKCVNDGIKLYRIREGLPPLNDSSIDCVVQRNQEDLSKILKLLLSEITETNVDIDLKRDGIAIENLREFSEKETSLLFSNPKLAKEWNYEKNNKLTTLDVLPNSSKKVWWKCNRGHEWQAKISDRNRGKGCPYCSGRYACKGENDLQTVNPTLAKEWNYEKNNGLTPADVMPNSDKKVWWKCSKGHEWQAIIANRHKGSGCPKCYKERKSKG